MPIETMIRPTLNEVGTTTRKGSIAPLAQSAMLVSLNLTGWIGRKKDKKVTAEVAENHKLDKDAGAYWKQVLDKSAINKVRAAAQAARMAHYENTLPWEDEGARILPSRNFRRYREILREVQSRWEEARAEFLANYPSLIEGARAALNGLFNEKDYPTVEQMAAKFTWEQKTAPVPDANDFRVDIADGERDRIKAELQSRHDQWLAQSSATLWNRLYETVERFANAVGNPDQQIIRSSLVEGMLELCEVLPDLNVSGDPELERLRQEVESKLCRRDIIGAVKDDTKDVRADLAKEARGVLDIMSAYTGQR